MMVLLKLWFESEFSSIGFLYRTVLPAATIREGIGGTRPPNMSRRLGGWNHFPQSERISVTRVVIVSDSLGARAPGTGGNILGTLKALDQFASDVSTRHSLITFGM